MWGGKDKIWQEHQTGILATDCNDGYFLEGFLRYARVQRLPAKQTEVIDLQTYRIIKKTSRVHQILKARHQEPFIFISGLN